MDLVESHGLSSKRWIEPLIVRRDQRARLWWSPCAGFVLVNRNPITENWIHDSPRLFNVILTCKTGRISSHGVEQ